MVQAPTHALTYVRDGKASSHETPAPYPAVILGYKKNKLHPRYSFHLQNIRFKLQIPSLIVIQDWKVMPRVVMCKGLQTLRGTRVGVRRVRVQVRIF